MKNYKLFVMASMLLCFVALNSCGNKSNSSGEQGEANTEQQATGTISAKYIEMAKEINKHTPMTIMENIQMDKAEALAGNVFKYYYTFTADPTADAEVFAKMTKPMIIPMLQNSPEMQEMKKDGVTLVYAYYKKDKSLFAEIKIAPEEY